MLKYLSIMYQSTDDLEPIERPPRWLVTVDSFSASRCYIYFKFKKADLFNLFELLNFPEDCKLYNGGSMKGEEVFLRGLFELCTGMNQTIICDTVMGREQGQQSFAFTYFINHIFDNYRQLLSQPGFAWWYRNGFMHKSADAVEAKMRAWGFPANLQLPFNVAYWIDCNCLRTSVVGGGPAEDGANAARWDESIQRAFYNGWKSIHGLKHQTGKYCN